jgi:hypothetical protein
LSEKIDVSLPGRHVEMGGLHPVTITLKRIQSLFVKNGFEVETGPNSATLKSSSSPKLCAFSIEPFALLRMSSITVNQLFAC